MHSQLLSWVQTKPPAEYMVSTVKPVCLPSMGSADWNKPQDESYWIFPAQVLMGLCLWVMLSKQKPQKKRKKSWDTNSKLPRLSAFSRHICKPIMNPPFWGGLSVQVDRAPDYVAQGKLVPWVQTQPMAENITIIVQKFTAFYPQMQDLLKR